jgi:hypothetical protein
MGEKEGGVRVSSVGGCPVSRGQDGVTANSRGVAGAGGLS